MKRHLFLLLILFLSGINLKAQIRFDELTEEQIYSKDRKYNIWSITAGYGPVVYYTDVVDYTIFPHGKWKFGPSVNIAYQWGRCWAIDINYLMANMYGQKDPAHYNRYFEGDFYDVTLNVTAYLNQLIAYGPLNDKWNIYAKIGFGVNAFRSMQKWRDDDDIIGVHKDDIINMAGRDIYSISGGYPTSYADWDNDDYFVMGYDRKNPTKKIAREKALLIPIGVGVRYRINKSFDLGFEATLRNLEADNLDVDMTGADNDSYMYAALSLTYKIGKKDKRHASWTYRDFNLDYSKNRARDPLAEKLDSLAKRLEYLAANDSIVNDTTRIVETKFIKKEFFQVSVFFDFDKSGILDMSHRTIVNIARYMKDNPESRMLIQGHCDARGSFEYNEKLSMRRCLAVKDILVKSYAIDEARFDVDPRGKRELLSDTNKLPKGVHLVNRRVDVIPITE
jgi:outer membrane protein OmpA-like peptidoglycan-associated protein